MKFDVKEAALLLDKQISNLDEFGQLDEVGEVMHCGV